MILWRGRSQLTGDPIMVVATAGSKNAKTGDMVQVWIIRRDIAPHAAAQSGADVAICGNCPQRHFLGGGCYVVEYNAPTSVFYAYQRHGYRDDLHRARMRRALREKPIRIGAYGDPAAVPIAVWERLLARGIGLWSGYTHQWRDPAVQDYRRFLMASCDSIEDAAEARALGWRTFTAVRGDMAPEASIECPADARGMTCAECGICNGTRFASDTARANVWINVHGPWRKKFSLPVVR